MITHDGAEEFYGKLTDIIPQLNEQIFCVVHKSFIINMRYVLQYRSDNILMTNGAEIPISRSMKKKSVKNKIIDNFF